MPRLSRTLGVAAVASLLLFGAAAPAAAHDELVASTPAPGDRLPAAPTEIALTFSSDVLSLGAAIIVADSEGRDWAAGEPVIEAGTVTVAVDTSMPDAGYEVRWRVVSSDGHPISGLIPFTVGEGAPLVRETGGPSVPAAESASGTTGEETSGDQNQSTTEDQGVIRLVLIGAAGAAVAVALFALVPLLRRRTAATRADGTGETVE